jgi:hypothetical protein
MAGPATPSFPPVLQPALRNTTSGMSRLREMNLFAVLQIIR